MRRRAARPLLETSRLGLRGNERDPFRRSAEVCRGAPVRLGLRGNERDPFRGPAATSVRSSSRSWTFSELDLFVLALDGLVTGPSAGSGAGRLTLAGRTAFGRRLLAIIPWALRGGRLVRGCGDLLKGLAELASAVAHGVHIGALQRFTGRLHGALDRGAILGRDLVAEVAQGALGLEDERVRLVAGLDLGPPPAVFLGVLLGVLDHAIDLVLVEERRGRDAHALFLAGGPILRLHIEDPVRVEVERDLDLGDPAWRRRDAVEDEAAERLVVGRHVPFAL